MPAPGHRSTWRTLLHVPRVGRRWPGAVRAGCAAGLPGLAGVLLGHGAVAAVAALGAFASVYGEGRPYRVRWRAVSAAGAMITTIVGIAAVVGLAVHTAVSDGASAWHLMGIVVTMTGVAVVCAFVVDALRVGPPGAFVPVLTFDVAATLPSVGVSVREVLGWTVVGAVSALVVSMSGAPWRFRVPERTAVAAARENVDAYLAEPSPRGRRNAVRSLHVAWECLHDARLAYGDNVFARVLYAVHVRCTTVLAGGSDDAEAERDELPLRIPLRRPTIRYRLGRALQHSRRTTTLAVRLITACVAAGAISIALGVGRPDWAVITAAMILHQGPDRRTGTVRGLHRFAGTVVGLLLLAVLSFTGLPPAELVVVVAALLAGTEVYLVRNYGVAMVFITPLAILLGGLGASTGFSDLVVNRMIETVIGVAIALGVLWAIVPFAHRWILRDADERLAESVDAVERAAGTRDSAERCRDLEFDLHVAASAAVAADHADPGWMKQNWARHHRLHENADRVLARSLAASPPSSA